MSMKYNFSGIEAGSSSILGAVNTTQGLLEEGDQSVQKLVEVWGGSGSERAQEVVRAFRSAAQELNDATKALAARISEAGQAMQQTESGVTNMFT